jgi:NAD-dependent SIR2 family protein deacetylase
MNKITAQTALSQSTGILITAGAGMGVDSGLPDFRGNTGFWQAYPALAAAGIGFTSIASLAAFYENPAQAWGFYGHRLTLYRDSKPHAGFALLKALADSKPQGAFVMTSNVTSNFKKRGLTRRGCTNATAVFTLCNAWARAARRLGGRMA